MKFKYISLFAVLPLFSHAGLVSLDNSDLQKVVGQANGIATENLGGADLSLTVSLNHRYANDLSLPNISKMNGQNQVINVADAYYSYECLGGNDVSCRLAISPNNHFENGQQKWLVFKQIQGTAQIEKFSLSGSTIINSESNPQTAMLLRFYDDYPLKLRNVGFKSLSVESGNEGYLNNSKYQTYSSNQAVPSFDRGQETGFMGVNIHGNLHMSGDVKIFSFNCTGAANSRC